MSEFHGGFFVRAVDAAVAEPIRVALAQALRAHRIDLDRHHLTFAARRGCPVMHVAVRGEAADGKDYAFFHEQHAELGAEVARAAGVDVWAYHYENQVGSESVRAFAPDGSERSAVYCSWDDLDEQLDDDLDDDDRHERLMEIAPLGVLAKTLGVPRGLLAMDLAYDTPTVTVNLVGPSCTAAVAAYLAQPLRAVAAAPVREHSTGELDTMQALYFPRWIAEELEAIAMRLGVSVGTIAWAAWEAAKDELHRTLETVDGGFLPAPPVGAPASIEVPRLVPGFAKSLPEPPTKIDQVMLKLALPGRMLGELQTFAFALDRSLSWTMQKAFTTVRGRLHAATPRS